VTATRIMPLPTLARTALAIGATAVTGGLGTDPTSSWYPSLDKSSWQPPPPTVALARRNPHRALPAGRARLGRRRRRTLPG
jgi:hypothetical protein